MVAIIYVLTFWWTFVLLISIFIISKYLKLRCANLYFKSLFYLHDYFKTITNSNLKA